VKNSEKPLLPAYTIFTTVKDSENPCCQPTPFYTVFRSIFIPLLPAYTILHGFSLHFHSLAASLHHFTTVKDSENPWCQPTPFYTVFCPISSPCRQPTLFYTFFCPIFIPLLPAYTVFYNSEKPLPPAYTILTTVKDSENPCRQPTPFYTVYCTISFPCCEPRTFYAGEGQ
jgi:hypothetical protein